MENLARYIIRASFSQEPMTYLPEPVVSPKVERESRIIYRSKRLGFPLEDVQIVFVNGKKVDLDTVLSNGDRLGLAPASGGM